MAEPKTAKETKTAQEDPRMSQLRRRLEKVAKEIRSIVAQGRSAIEDTSQKPKFRAMYSVLDRYFEKLESYWDEFQDLSEGKEGLPTTEDTNLFEAGRRYYFECRMIADSLESGTPSRDQNLSASRLEASSSHLPRLSIPKFDGELAHWPRFRDSFLSIVHNDPALSEMTKFHYLTVSLSGPAAAVISHLPLLASNYDLAWTALVKAYDNKRLLASSYINTLLESPPLSGKITCGALSSFVTHAAENVAALKMLSIPNLDDFLLFYLSFRRLDPTTREQFELHQSRFERFPTFDDLSAFLQNRTTALQMADFNSLRVGSSSIQSPSRPNRNSPRSSLTVEATKPDTAASCHVCKKPHKLIECSTFVTSDPNKRRQLLKGFLGCFNCLAGNHKSYACPSKNRCRLCRRTHHTLLHAPTPPGSSSSGLSASQETEKPQAALYSASSEPSNVLLGTAVACFLDIHGYPHPARLVVDSGSQFSLITDGLRKRLGLPLIRSNRSIQGIGQTPFHGMKGKTTCMFRPRGDNSPTLSCEASVVDSITSDMPNFPMSIEEVQPFLSLPLADPGFWVGSKIDFLLGADLFPQIISGKSVKLTSNGPWIMDSTFGKLVMGTISANGSSHSGTSLSLGDSNDQELDLDHTLRRFWEIEENPSSNAQYIDEIAENQFLETHGRTPEGRYVVRLPWKKAPPDFENTLTMASTRFRNLELKLSRNTDLRQKYVTFMKEYEQLGHMYPANSPSLYVLPHHGILRKEKLRVVFDASAPTSRGCLNDYLAVGPKLQKDIRDILLAFRIHTVVIVADIVRMYRQILVHDKDCRYQHVLWREDLKHPVQTFELRTLTYGTSCAPYLAQRVLQQLVQDEGSEFPLASTAILSDMYMDDLVTGCASEAEAHEMRRQVVDLMKKGGFELSKWSSNCPTLLPSSLDFHSFVDDSNTCQILGTQWDPQTDTFSYHLSVPSVPQTKRGMLSFIARIYDPLGLLAPVCLMAKGIIQDLWKAGINWDEEAPENIKEQFQALSRELPQLADIRIPRQIISDGIHKVQIAGFADASLRGYSATIYVRRFSNECQTVVSLLTARTRLAPLKVLSVPRLELCGALLLAKTFSSIQDFLRRLPCPSLLPVFFTDSKIVLHWLKTPAFKLKTFVANRVVEILSLTSPQCWHHVRSMDNPSDLSSRGLLPSQLMGNNLWWKGPDWLASHQTSWTEETTNPPDDLPELKDDRREILVLTAPALSLSWMDRFSDLSALIRVCAWIRRFLHNSAHNDQKIVGPLTLEEIRSATFNCIKMTQSFHFFEGKPLCLMKRPSHLDKLSPFIDSSGLLRVGGRLSQASLLVNTKHPILLPKDCHFSKLLVDHYHKAYLHPGPSLLQALIQRKYWIVGLRRLVRQRFFLCLKCYRDRAAMKSLSPIMADLPEPRVNLTRAFNDCGVDFAGPFPQRASLLRKAPNSKMYLALFVCMATKAIHLETVSDLSTNAFLASFTRFISRRGCPSKMYSDCGKNFQGAARYLKECYQWWNSEETKNSLIRYGNDHELTWMFNPPYSPHFGGLWEAGVKSVKSILRKIVGETALTFEEWNTVFAKVEAILNSRPLGQLSTSPEEIDYLTPGHFLVGTSLVAPPEESLHAVPQNRLSRWQLVKKLSDLFWKRWSLEYLSTLQARVKWTKNRPSLITGDIVLLKEPGPSLKWPMGIVKSTHPGKDGVVRVVTIRIGQQEYLRPVHKLVPLLPLKDNPYS